MTQIPTSPRVHVRPDLSFSLSEAGTGRPVLILHGGGGPFTVAGIAAHLSSSMHTLMPTHPGWNGSERPEWFSGIDDLALLYLHYLEDKGLQDVLVIGSSIGGWIAAELALRDMAGRVTGLILIDTVGIEVSGEPIRDFFALTPHEVAEFSYHDAERFYVDPASIPAEQLALRRGNMAALRVYAGDPYMHDPKLVRRLDRVRLPALVLWGDSDRIVTPAYGQAFAGALGNARFTVIDHAGHLPQIEQPEATFRLLDDYLASTSQPSV
jgi:pimeloyl-ACP methyl ester carboxylesterase